MKYLTIDDIANDNALWIRYALQISKNKDYADEMVADMYIRLIDIKSRNLDKTFSKVYMYRVLKNSFLIMLKEKSKIDKSFDIEEIGNDDDEYTEDELDALDFYNYTLEYISNITDRSDWFHKTIFKYVMIDGLSIRELARKSNIHFNILQSSIQATKKRLKENYKNNYE